MNKYHSDRQDFLLLQMVAVLQTWLFRGNSPRLVQVHLFYNILKCNLEQWPTLYDFKLKNQIQFFKLLLEYVHRRWWSKRKLNTTWSYFFFLNGVFCILAFGSAFLYKTYRTKNGSWCRPVGWCWVWPHWQAWLKATEGVSLWLTWVITFQGVKRLRSLYLVVHNSYYWLWPARLTHLFWRLDWV